MNTYETLIAAKELIKDPENWMQGDYTNGKGCYCALGSLIEVAGVGSHYEKAQFLLVEVVERELEVGETFSVYNDNHDHRKVMEAFDKAIALAKERGI